MSLSEDRIRELALNAISELGDKATPEAVKNYIEENLQSSIPEMKPEAATSGRVILTSFGYNHTGIVAAISKVLSDCQCDIQDISQKIMHEFFTMIMMVDITNSPKDIKELQEMMSQTAESLKVKIYLQHEDVFRYMHRI